VRSMLRFMFVVVPTAVLATAVVVGVSAKRHGAAATADGDLLQDLKLASTTSLELAPAGQPLAMVSALESAPSPTPERTTRPKRSRSGSRSVRSHTPVVTVAAEPEVAEATDEPETTATDLASATVEAPVEAPAAGGVALPRPSAIPVVFPTDGADPGTYDPGPGSVIRGGGVYGDHCQVHGGRGGRIYSPVYRQPRASRGAIAERIRGAQSSGESRRGPIAERVRQASGRSGSEGRSSGGALAGRMRAARGR
jgi:hypothetical protein